MSSPHTTVGDLVAALEDIAPTRHAEPWDNVGLLLGDARVETQGVMTCLTLTEEVAEEAIREGANLVITHHPILFKAVKRLTTGTSEGRLLLRLAQAGVSVYSPHTAFDSAREGINQQIAVALGLCDIQPIRMKPQSLDGSGRWGQWAALRKLSELLDQLKSICPAEQYTHVGDLDRMCGTVAIACGAAGDFLPDAAALGCHVFVTGETRFHTCLEARSLGMALIMVGHYASERPAVETLARQLAAQWSPLRVWASGVETDPVRFHP